MAEGHACHRPPRTPAPRRSCPCSRRPTAGATRSSPPTPHPHRRQARATGLPGGPPPRPRPRVEDSIRNGKNTGLGHLPSKHYSLNQARCLAATIAADLLAWLRLLCLSGELAKAEPKTLRYRLLHTAARIIRGQRRRRIRIPQTWPRARELASALTTALTLPMTT
ncbi:MAG: transposase [Kineosporiaceae bacterium]|nr:transposase [Kineosporiaceae bacterium]